MLCRRALILSLLLLFFCGNVCTASIALYGVSPGVSFTGHDGAGETLGWSFSVTSPIDVVALGVYDENADGLTNTHDVGLWDKNKTLLASITVPNGTGAALEQSFRFESINPISLTVGELYYIGALYRSPSDADSVLMSVSSWITPLEISYDSRRIGDYSSSLSFPEYAGNGLNGYFGANFQFEAAGNSTVPEPSTAIIWLVFSTLGLTIGWRRRKAA
jgi:hypothetical protein